MPQRLLTRCLAFCVLAWTVSSCAAPPRPGDPLVRRGDEISVCGQLIHTGTPVVLWTDPGGYDAYRVENRFRAQEPEAGTAQPASSARYGTWRRNLPAAIEEGVHTSGWTVDRLGEVVHLFVLHFDAAGTSRRCFEILQDVRQLSVHFMLDVDGTIYQTLDLKERAWHATIANDHGIGIEIAHPGAFPQPGSAVMKRWYESDEAGTYMNYPAFLGDPGVRTEGYVPRPDRDGIHSGRINDRTIYQRDFTTEQYRALAHLTAALHRVFPRLPLEVPRTESGDVRPDQVPPADLREFEGIVGHFHVQANKVDPGPAFQWERLLRDARELLR